MNKHLRWRVKYSLLGVAGFLLALLIWSLVEPYHLDRENVTASIPSLPQACVEDKSSWSWLSKIKGDTVRVSGWILCYRNAGNHLYINRGIEFSNLPIRFNCPPELTVFILEAKT